MFCTKHFCGYEVDIESDDRSERISKLLSIIKRTEVKPKVQKKGVH
jgi:hypothetical protein